jgi:hypothetical protein
VRCRTSISGFFRRLPCQSGLRGAPPNEATRRTPSPYGTYIKGFVRRRPLFAPVIVTKHTSRPRIVFARRPPESRLSLTWLRASSLSIQFGRTRADDRGMTGRSAPSGSVTSSPSWFWSRDLLVHFVWHRLIVDQNRRRIGGSGSVVHYFLYIVVSTKDVAARPPRMITRSRVLGVIQSGGSVSMLAIEANDQWLVGRGSISRESIPPSTRPPTRQEAPRLRGFSATGATGLEPATSDVTGRRSNQLSYAPWNGPSVCQARGGGGGAVVGSASNGRATSPSTVGSNGCSRTSDPCSNPAVGVDRDGRRRGPTRVLVAFKGAVLRPGN